MIFKIKPKMLKYYSNKKNTMNVIVNNIVINKNIIMKILNIFKFENIIVITDINKNTNIFNELKINNIKYTTSIFKEKDIYIETILMIPHTDRKILNSILDNNIEAIFIYNIKEFISWEQYLYNSNYLQNNKKANEISDLHFEFIFNENTINVSYNTQLYNPVDINDKIKLITMSDGDEES